MAGIGINLHRMVYDGLETETSPPGRAPGK